MRITSGPAYSRTSGIVNKTTDGWTTLVTSVVGESECARGLDDRPCSLPRRSGLSSRWGRRTQPGLRWYAVCECESSTARLLRRYWTSASVVSLLFQATFLMRRFCMMRDFFVMSLIGARRHSRALRTGCKRDMDGLVLKRRAQKKGYVLCSLVTGIDGAEDGQSLAMFLWCRVSAISSLANLSSHRTPIG